MTVALGFALLLAGCTYTGRSARELEDTPFGAMPTPSGTDLRPSVYMPTSFGEGEPTCAHIDRSGRTQDPAGFMRSLERVALESGAHIRAFFMPPTIYTRDDRLLSNDAEFEVAGTIAWARFTEATSADKEAGWPYEVKFQVWDRLVRYGGGCS